ncbi:MAG TPA: chromosome condensation regulator RCC1 [Actinomycetota bacterium]|jgi:alpha-tubulin suppressor-like RCC1 family protein|nr:chromosome condensation regulator RCC1 [Actinomycetota bacterium]
MHLTPRGSHLTRIVAAVGLVAGALVIAAPAAQAVNVSSVSAGAVHACVRTTAGAAKCWGFNAVGMVGDGTKVDRLQPTTVKGLKAGVQDVQAVWDHSCAVTNGGGVKCWGHNGDGELGDGSLITRINPAQVQGLNSGVQQVTLGFDSGCALKTTGTVWCWGYNGNGQLGTGDRQSQRTPVDAGLSGITQISAGWDHTCGVTNAGGVKCWGQGKHGEIGDGAKSDRLSPVDVTGLGGTVDQVSAGFDHTCALMTGGTVKCWGNNNTGELGNGTTTDSTHPVTVSGLSGVAAISAGYNHTCAVTTSGAAKCWGANESGELGDGTTKNRSTAVTVYRSGSGVAQISAGGYQKTGMTCLVTNSGAVKCFGANHGVHDLAPIDSTGGQLGDGTKIDRHIPITVRSLTGGSPARYRPDLSISKHKSAGYAGNGIYNTSGARQVKTVKMAPGGKKHLFVHLQNDAHVTDSFFLSGTGSGGGFSISYATGGHNIKGSVTSGTYWVTVPAGGQRTVVITISSKKTAHHGTSRSLKLIARSAGDSAKVDVVKGIMKIT